ncbi:transposase, partial [Lysobacter sp. 2RAB21]
MRFNSVKNGHARVLESHTCELIHAYELEFDRDVLGYYVQAQCPRVIRTTRDGRKHVSTAHLDFLVFRKSSVELVECKQLGWLEAECAKPNSRWCNVGSHWSYEPYAHWAKQRGLD